jgi:GDP-4-dehydro-6-deoxy-D-mannose reductase
MRVMVTGADGFVGGLLAASLRGDGHEVFALSRRGSRGMLACDITDPQAIARAVRTSAPDQVFHLAAQASAARSWSEPALTYEVNVTGTHLLLEELRATAPAARVLLACTSDEYGAVAPHDCPIDEDTPLRPLSPYAVSKVAEESLGRMYHGAFGTAVVATRAFMHIGPGQPPRFATADWARRIALGEAGKATPEIRVGNLALRRELGDVRDVVAAYRSALDFGSPGEAYNVATGEAPTLEEALELLLGMSETEFTIEVDAARVRPADPPILQGDASRLEHITGWAPKHRLKDTLAEVLDYWRARVREGAKD